MPANSPFLAAVVQASTVSTVGVADSGATLDKLAALAAECAGRGAKLAVFPEAFVGGYPKGEQFGVSLGIRTAEGREQFRAYFEGAIDVPGPATEQIGAAAKSGSLHLVVGVIERAGGTLYCTALFFAPSGELLGKHRKLVPTALERVLWGQGDGSTLPVLDTPLGKLGAVICWENYMPLLRAAMFAKGIQLYCAPTVDDRDSWLPSMRHIACEGRCFVLSACQFLPGANSAQPLIRGGSSLVDPFGRVLAGPHFGSETILTAEIDPAEITRGKFDFDVAGHYARPDIFQLRINESS